MRDGLDGALDGLDRGVGVQVLYHSLGAEQQRREQGDRQQDVEGGTGEIDPEIPDARDLVPREAANDSDRSGDAHRRGGEVLHRQRSHLHQVAHRRFGRVGLPVRVGEEADRGVVGQVRRNQLAAEALRIERQVALQPLQRVDEQESENAECQHASRVVCPALLRVLPDAAELVDQALQGANQHVEEGALALKHLRHEQAKRLREQQDEAEKHGDLENPIPCHRALRIFPGEAAPRSDTPAETHT